MSADEGQKPNLYVLHGPDQFSARERLAEISQSLGLADSDGGVTRLEGRSLTADELRNACQTRSFFAEAQLVVVDGLLQRLGGTIRRRRPSRARRQSADSGDSSDGSFLAALADLPKTTTLVLLDESVSRDLLEALGPQAKAEEFRVLRRDGLRQWVRDRARKRGVTIAPAAVERLTEVVDGDHLAQLAQEIDKLSSYALGRTIEVTDVEALVSGALTYRFYDLTDAVIAGQVERALQVLHALDARESPPQLVMSVLASQFRQLLLAQALLREGMTAPDIGTRLRIPQPFPLSKVIDQATRYPHARLDAAYRRILNADVALKTGVLDADMALEMLVADLSLIGASGRTRRRS